MWIQAGNNYSKIIRAEQDELEWVVDYLTFSERKYNGRMGYQENTCLLDRVEKTFPSGLIRKLLDAAKKDKVQIQIIDKRNKPCSFDPTANLDWLRDYQLEAVEAAAKRSRGILWLPTGSGKGEIVVALTRALPCNWLFVVHRSGLMYDIADRYEARNAEHYSHDPAKESQSRLVEHPVAGRIGDGNWSQAEDGESSLTCATFQTLAAAKAKGDARFEKLAARADAVVFDEAHTLPAASFWKVAMAFKNAYYRIALSGTPLARGDRRSVYTIAATGSVAYRIKPQVLIDAGVLARPKIKMIHCEQESDKPTWQGAYGELVVRSVTRNKLVIEAARKAQKPCLVFVKEVKHGKVLRDRLRKAGISSDFTWGSDSQKARDHSVERLVRGDTDVLVCSVVFQEGVDVPELESVIIASGGKSVIATLQRIGRGMRSNQGKKKTFEVYDFADNGNRWLQRHARARRNAYLKEGHEVTEVRLGGRL